MRSGTATATALPLTGLVVSGLGYMLATRPSGARWTAVMAVCALLLALAMSRPRSAALAFLTWAPFLALTRRAIYALSPYTGLDPILLVGPAVCALLVSVALISHRPLLAAALRQSYAARCVAALLLVFALAVLNPLQGGLMVGFGGALFFLVPLSWFIVGRLYLDRRAAGYLVGTLVTVAFVSSAYGLRQAYYGYLSFEQYWVEHGGYTALSVYGIIRPVSTFASSAEFVTFATCGLAAAVALLIRGRLFVVPLLAMLPVIGWAVLTNGSRGAVVRFAAAVILLFALRGKSAPARVVGALLAVTAVFAGVSQWNYEPGQYLDVPIVGPFLERQAQGLSDPLGEQSTLPSKIDQLKAGLIGPLVDYPLGLGLGSPTLAAAKFGGAGFGLELDLSDMFVAGGLPAGLLYLALNVLLVRRIVRLWFATRDWLYAALAAMFMVIAGTALAGGYYALTPLWWTLMGWTDREYAAAWPLSPAAHPLSRPAPAPAAIAA